VHSRCARHLPGAAWGFLLSLTLGTSAIGGLIDIELTPPMQTVNVADTVGLEVQIFSADGNSQSVGFVGVVIHWDPTMLTLLGHNDNGPFSWTSSGFPSGSGGLNIDLTDGDAYYQASASSGGPYANVTAGGLLVTTLEFQTLAAATGTTQVSIEVCDGTACTTVSNKLPHEGGINITGAIGPPAEVTVECQSAVDCDDGNPCTDDDCIANACSSVPDDMNDPNDGLYCNGLEIGCDNGVVVIQSGSIPDCDDALACTVDTCDEVNDECDNDPAPSFCVIDDICYAESALNPLNECEWCESAASSVSWTLRPDGAPCGNPQDTECDLADTCDGAGVCQTNFAPVDTPCGSMADTTCTDPDSCDGAGNCLPHHAPDMTDCDDGVFCTLADECTNGVCAGAGDPCPLLVCDEINDLCKRVDLEWRDVLPNPLPVGEIVEVGFFVESANGMNQAISSVSLVLQWDADKLALVGKIDNGPYAWLSSSFPNDSALDGLNDTFADGNALYQALGALANPATVTPAGLLVTTFRFQTLQSGTTGVFMMSQIASTPTRVVDVDPAGLIITGVLGTQAVIEIVDCDEASDCDDGEFCNGVEDCVDNSCVPGVPPDCDDGLFCNGAEVCTAGVGCESPGNPCALPESCDDVSDTCGGCLTPVVQAEGSRYFRVTPQAGAEPVALYVMGDLNDPDVACVEGYLRADGAINPFPLYQTPAQWGTVHVTGCEVKPNTKYHVFADCSPQLSGLFSAGVSATTWRWGDVNGNGLVNIADFSAVSDASNGNFGSLTVPNVDLAPCRPDGVIDSADVAAAQSALNGNPFPCPEPCVGGARSSACSDQIPAASTWGLVVLALLTASVGTFIIRQSATSAAGL
jgi:hypothetical protein